MVLEIRDHDAIFALDVKQMIDVRKGTGWDQGGEASVASTAGEIEITIEKPVAGRYQGDIIFELTGTTILSDNTTEYPRRDLIYIHPDQTIDVQEGTPAPTDEAVDTSDPAKVRQSDSPPPPDMSTVDGVALATVFVPSGATESADIEPEYVRDRRVPVDQPQLLYPDSQETVTTEWEFTDGVAVSGRSSINNVRYVDPADGYSDLQAELDDLGTTPGTVYIGAGEITDITDNITVPSNTWLVGAGRDSTTLKLANTPNLSLAGTVRLDDGVSNVIVSDLTIDGNRANVTDNGDEYCFYTSGATEWQLTRVRARNAPGYGIDPHDASGTPSETFLISDCISHGHGLDGFVSAGNLRGAIVNCYSYNNDSSGFNIVENPGDHVELYNCHAWDNDEGITIQKQMHGCAIVGGSAVNNTGAGIRLGSSGGEIEYCRLNGVRVVDNGGYGVNVRGSNSIAITNCIFRNNASGSDNADISLQLTQSGTVPSEYCSVTNCVFEGVNQTYAIDERSGSGPTTVVGNTFRGTYGSTIINLTNAGSEDVANIS